MKRVVMCLSVLLAACGSGSDPDPEPRAPVASQQAVVGDGVYLMTLSSCGWGQVDIDVRGGTISGRRVGQFTVAGNLFGGQVDGATIDGYFHTGSASTLTTGGRLLSFGGKATVSGGRLSMAGTFSDLNGCRGDWAAGTKG